MKKWIAFLLFVGLFLSWGTESFSMEESDSDGWEEVVPVRLSPVRRSSQEERSSSSLTKQAVLKLPPDIFGVPLSEDLRELNLSHKGINLDRTSTLILVLPGLPEVKTLNLSGNCVNACCVQILNPYLRNLHTLLLAYNRLGDHGINLLEIPPTLTELDVTKNGIGPKGAATLARKLRERPDFSILDFFRNSKVKLPVINACN